MKKTNPATNASAPNKSETPKFPTVGTLDSFLRYPLELHASIASRLLEGDDYEKAADRAFKLLLACNERLFKDRFETQRVLASEILAEMLRHVDLMHASVVASDNERMPFDPAIKLITGQERADRAEEDYHRYFTTLHPADAADTEYEQEKQQGIPLKLMLWRRIQYLAERESTGLGGKRRRTKKIH
jgi:hypothetical protein